jgi:hypothetical protein
MLASIKTVFFCETYPNYISRMKIILHFEQKVFRFSRPQPGCHALTKLSLAENYQIIPGQGDFG